MATTKKIDLPETDAPAQENLMQEMMAKLQRMQEEMAVKMAELTAKQAELEERERALNEEHDASPRPVPPAISNAWKEMQTIILPRARGGEQNFVLVGVNGQQWKVPRGKAVEVPMPLYERLQIMLDQEEMAYRERERVTQKAYEEEQKLMRMR
jgi:hypothetical protein